MRPRLHRWLAARQPSVGADPIRQTGIGRASYTDAGSSRADEPPEQQTFLNSYIAADLALISAALDRGNAGTALSQYLATHPGTNRTDVQKEPLCVRAGCAPGRIPSGRWVTDTNRPLTFSQQFAVNQILRTLSDTCGLFAVNGPPGTGKTTMLRDVIAAVVVKRAIELACLTSPTEAFTTAREQWKPVRYSQHDHHPQSEGDWLRDRGGLLEQRRRGKRQHRDPQAEGHRRLVARRRGHSELL